VGLEGGGGEDVDVPGVTREKYAVIGISPLYGMRTRCAWPPSGGRIYARGLIFLSGYQRAKQKSRAKGSHGGGSVMRRG
jgi:hypothetical protein